MNKKILFISVFIFCYCVLSIFLNYFESLGRYLSTFFQYLGIYSFTTIFLILFLFQIFLLSAIFYTCFWLVYRLNIKDFINLAIKFIKQKLVWLGVGYFIKYCLLMYVLFLFFISFLFWIVSYFGLDIPGLFGKQQTVDIITSFDTKGVFDYLIIFFVVAILGPIWEEVIFRGVITTIMFERFGAVLGGFFSSAIFALAHLENQVVILLFIVSVFLTYIYYRTKSLYYTFGFHFIFNFVTVMTIFVLK